MFGPKIPERLDKDAQLRAAEKILQSGKTANIRKMLEIIMEEGGKAQRLRSQVQRLTGDRDFGMEAIGALWAITDRSETELVAAVARLVPGESSRTAALTTLAVMARSDGVARQYLYRLIPQALANLVKRETNIVQIRIEDPGVSGIEFRTIDDGGLVHLDSPGVYRATRIAQVIYEFPGMYESLVDAVLARESDRQLQLLHIILGLSQSESMEELIREGMRYSQACSDSREALMNAKLQHYRYGKGEEIRARGEILANRLKIQKAAGLDISRGLRYPTAGGMYVFCPYCDQKFAMMDDLENETFNCSNCEQDFGVVAEVGMPMCPGGHGAMHYVRGVVQCITCGWSPPLKAKAPGRF